MVIYIADKGRISKVNSLGIITTIAGTGIAGFSGDGGLATNAQLSAGVAGMIMDASGNLYIADRGNARVRMVNVVTGIITTVAGSTFGTSGDNGPATAAQLANPISIAIDFLGNLIIADNQNDIIRKVDVNTGIITAIAGVGIFSPGSTAEGVPADTAKIHPEFIYMDLDSNIYFSTFSNKIRKITNYLPGLGASGSNCTKHPEMIYVEDVISNEVSIYPNPVGDRLNITGNRVYNNVIIVNSIGQKVMEMPLTEPVTSVDIASLPAGIYLCILKGNTTSKVTRFIKNS